MIQQCDLRQIAPFSALLRWHLQPPVFLWLDIRPGRHYNVSWRQGMAFIRSKRKGNRIYYYLVESKREGNKVRQKVIKYLGTEMPTREQIQAMRREE